HRVAEIALGRASRPDRKNHRMGYADGAEAGDELAARLRRAERPDTAHIVIAEGLVGFVTLAFTPQPAHFGELRAEPLMFEHLVVCIDEGVTGKLALERVERGVGLVSDAHPQIDRYINL